MLGLLLMLLGLMLPLLGQMMGVQINDFLIFPIIDVSLMHH